MDYIYDVSCVGHETVRVTGPEKLRAIQAAAKAWKVPWTTVARDCVVLKLSEAKPKEQRKRKTKGTLQNGEA